MQRFAARDRRFARKPWLLPCYSTGSISHPTTLTHHILLSMKNQLKNQRDQQLCRPSIISALEPL